MKSPTDLHWSRRAVTVDDVALVNMTDIFQREVELAYLGRYLTPEMTVLEVGCGNGFSTDRIRRLVAQVDAFDYSHEMIERARTTYGETNNRFFCDNVLRPEHMPRDAYDAVVCVRVLINLRDLDQQLAAIRVLATLARPGGILLLLEGFADGFAGLSGFRARLELEPLQPAPINFYSAFDDLRPELERHFELEESFHLGAYDYLTRVVYPALIRPEEPQHNSAFHERAAELALAFNPDCFATLSRMRGLVLRRRPG